MSDFFKDKVAVVTGASSGIGRVTATAFAREGCRVVLANRRVDVAIPLILRRLEVEQDEFVREVILGALKRLEG